MDKKTVLTSLGATAAASLVALGTVAIGAQAQTSTATSVPSTTTSPTAQATPNASGNQNSEAPHTGQARGPGRGRGGDFGPGEGFGDLGAKGFGPKGAALTADGANRVITGTTSLLTTVKNDLTYAIGKMDTTNVQKWLNSADTLLKDAQASVTATKYERAALDAEAARSLITIAEGQMAQTLGADKLPSASQLPQGREGHLPGATNGTATAPTQAQASRILAQTYNRLVAAKATIKAGDASAYLTDAQNAYQSAYTAYNAAKYTEAVSAAKLAEQLAGVAERVQSAANAPDNVNTAVPVPAPNF